MFIFEAAAMLAALAWAFTSILSADPAKHLGAIAFNRWRMTMVFIALATWVTLFGSWSSITGETFWPLFWSGFIGIFLGDTVLFLTMNRMGPRRTAILFSMNAPMSVVLGYLFLDEALAPQTFLGVIITICGVILAIIFGKRKTQLHKWESVTGSLWVGILFGTLAALAQALGALIARPVMESGVDPVAASALRVGTASLGLLALMFLPYKNLKQTNPGTVSIWAQVALSGLLGMGLGMTLLLFALSGGKVGVITTLSATTPALLLPILWWRTKEAPALGAWIGAILVVLGSALIFNG
ncbi:DMT family transporter [Ahrensia marina]|uniref:Membrane protein n=1 Tax=Ahrensia marina TaxID=1514904 RepID=A0A0N0E757_9HYPH|nr:DMT family transporter [Ahrensia marina]KPB00742.1 membrane protein [Ahrensia marina]